MAIGRIPEPGTGIQESIIAAKGDLISGTANDVPAILTVGADGTTLVADSAEATGLKWATPAGSVPANDSATVATSETTTSTTYTALTTAGPEVTVTTGTKALVIVTAFLRNSTSSAENYMGYSVSGATTISATDATALNIKQSSAGGSSGIRASGASVVTLTSGSNVFTALYRVNGGTGTFANRTIFVINLA